MTELRRRALARLALNEEQVARLYAEYEPAPSDRLRFCRVVRDLCTSHERLRAELLGAEALLAEDRPVVAAAMEMLAELEQDYGNGVRNGYWPDMAPRIDRWRAALGLPPLERFTGGRSDAEAKS